MNKQMNKEEMSEYLKDKSQEEIRNFIIERMVRICEEAEKLSVNDEDYEKANELLKIKKKLK